MRDTAATRKSTVPRSGLRAVWTVVLLGLGAALPAPVASAATVDADTTPPERRPWSDGSRTRRGPTARVGVLGIAVAADFTADPWLYVIHTTTTDNRVVRVRYTGGVLTGTPEVLLTGVPRNKYHNGGRLRFGPDGKLYIATGDGQNGDWAQDRAYLAGKVLRINRDGTIPSDNPFGTPVWSYGHRNPQGLAFDSQGRLWEQEFGNNVMDETNLIVRGGNYGWPLCEGTTGSCGDKDSIPNNSNESILKVELGR
jgi:glucose/arabinose dehydrogenase